MYHDSIGWDSHNARAHSGLGHLLFLQGQYAAALASLQYHAPHDAVSALYLGLAEHALGDHETALATWRAARADCYFVQLGQRAEKTRDPASAEDHYLTAMQIGPDLCAGPEGLLNPLALLGDLYRKQKRWIEAAEAYAAAIDLTPATDPELYYWFAWVQAFGLRQHNQAIMTFHQALALFPGHVWQYLGLGEVYLAKGDYPEAEHWFSVARQVAPNDPWPVFYLGTLYFHQGRYGQALSFYEEAIEAGADDARTRYELGVAYLRSNRLEEARSQLLCVVDQAPGYANAWKALGEVYAALGDSDSATSAYERARQIDTGEN